MNFDDLWALVPTVLSEMNDEFLRKGVEHFDENPTSQHTACFLLAIRSASLLRGMGELLKPETFDSWDVLMRAFMESRDLLMTFRFDDEKTRTHIREWFSEKGKETWRPNHKACEAFMSHVGAGGLELAKSWGRFSGLSHPTHIATQNSAAIAAARVRPRPELAIVLKDKQADYGSALVSLFITASYELSGWIDLGFDTSRTPMTEKFRIDATDVLLPIVKRMQSRP